MSFWEWVALIAFSPFLLAFGLLVGAAALVAIATLCEFAYYFGLSLWDFSCFLVGAGRYRR